mgnify:CR=1 FL=1
MVGVLKMPKKGKKASEEARKNMSLSHTGLKQSEETKKRRSIALRGYKQSEEHIKKMQEELKSNFAGVL